MSLHNTPPCSCNIVAELLADPESGLTLDEDGTYLWKRPDPFVNYYCWNCNGVLPNLWNARISDEERERLQEIIESVSTAEGAIEKLGAPAYDAYMGYGNVSDYQHLHKTEHPHASRNLVFDAVSEFAQLEFYFHGDSKPKVDILIKFTDAEIRELTGEPEPYDGDDNGNEPMEATLYETDWVKCPQCGWRFCLKYATHSGEWPVHPRCGQRLKVVANQP